MGKKNIVMIMTDQQRWDAMGCVNPLVITPGIDSLAQNGIRYDQAVCNCPMCVPSRNSLMFGMLASQTGVRTNSGALLDETRLPAVPLPQILHDAGYLCAGFGKTHWNHTTKGRPGSRRGFDVRAEGQSRNSVLYEEGAVMMDDEDPQGLADYYEETKEFGGGEENAYGYLGKRSTLPKEHHRDGFIYKKCMEFLDGYEPDDKPLFLYLSFIKPHAGYNIPPEFEDLYDLDKIPPIPHPPWDDEPDTHIRAAMGASTSLTNVHQGRKTVWETLPDEQKRMTTLRYYANCTFMDYFIKNVLKKIHEKGLDKDTLFLFMSDHGEMMGERDYRYSKYCLYDGSVRVPLILAGDPIPEAQKGTVDSRPAMLVDVVPTICAYAGIPCDPRLPGTDLLGSNVREGAFCEFHGGGNEWPQVAPSYMWRNSRYKLILYREGTVLDATPCKGELYDLEKDPHEWTNLFYAPEMADIRFRMTAEMMSYLATAYAKGPAFGDYNGYRNLTPKS